MFMSQNKKLLNKLTKNTDYKFACADALLSNQFKWKFELIGGTVYTMLEHNINLISAVRD